MFQHGRMERRTPSPSYLNSQVQVAMITLRHISVTQLSSHLLSYTLNQGMQVVANATAVSSLFLDSIAVILAHRRPTALFGDQLRAAQA